MFGYLKRRLEERTTWAALGAACAASLGAMASVSGISPVIINSLAAGVAISGFVGAMLPSPKRDDRDA